MSNGVDREKAVQNHVASSYEDVRYRKDHSMVWYRYLFGKMLRNLAPAPCDRILDNGCGIGKFEEMTGCRGIVGSDFSHNMLARARARIPAVVQADSVSLPFRDGCFTKAFTIGVIHHLEDGNAGVGEMCRVLEPGGRMVIAETNRTLLSSIPRLVVYRRSSHFSELHRNYSKKDLLKLLEGRFDVEKIEYIGYIGYPFIGVPDICNWGRYIPGFALWARLLLGIDRLFSVLPLIRTQSWGIVITARRKGRPEGGPHVR